MESKIRSSFMFVLVAVALSAFAPSVHADAVDPIDCAIKFRKCLAHVIGGFEWVCCVRLQICNPGATFCNLSEPEPKPEVARGAVTQSNACADNEQEAYYCETDADCMRTGCYQQICADRPVAVRHCEAKQHKAVYDCFKPNRNTACGCHRVYVHGDPNDYTNQCTWYVTPELYQCVGEDSWSDLNTSRL